MLKNCFMKLPEKYQIDEWQCEPVVLRLMSENRWSRQLANQWFQDFMRWLYTASRVGSKEKKPFSMDGLSYLDDVWHAYILHTKLYFEMSRQLFDVEFIHHTPENPFGAPAIDSEVFEKQLMALLEDWGEPYIDRVYAYGADLSDITSGAEIPAH